MEIFQNIGIIGRLGSHSVIHTTERLAHYLLQKGYHVILDQRISEVMPGHNMQTSTLKSLGETCDLVVVVGGDGSLLGAARALAIHQTPIVGINRGTLGFLTDINPDDHMLDTIQAVLDGQYQIETRSLLHIEAKRNDLIINTGSALNDIVLHPGKSRRMISFDLLIEGQFVYKQRSDGLIVSTPTGSTAYSLSAGGPILHPKLDALILVPMFPQSLSSRPIVIDGNHEIKLIIHEDNTVYPTVSCDGQHHIPCSPNDTLTIRKKAHKLKLIHPNFHDFYHTCRTKLGWGSRQPNAS